MKNYSVKIENRDEINATVDEAGVIKYSGKGCLSLLEKLEWARSQAPKLDKLQALDLSGNEHTDLLFKELQSKILGRWDLPYKDKELCHCRAVETNLVVSSIYSGADTLAKVGSMCSAGTSCGNCQPDIGSCLSYLKKT